jgi:hypothetical protein
VPGAKRGTSFRNVAAEGRLGKSRPSIQGTHEPSEYLRRSELPPPKAHRKSLSPTVVQ